MERMIPYGHMVHEYYVEKIRAVQAERRKRLYAAETRGEAEALVQRAREAVRACFEPFPERTPLNPEVTGVVEREGYRVEKVVFESRPGFHVTANLYVPTGSGPFPCVLGACGHAAEGKARDLYQYFCQGLVRRGYLVLIYDPVSQGERLQYLDAEGEPLPRRCTEEHTMMGNQMRLCGDYLGTWRVWDGIRALDYLLGRPEADRERVGVTGNSGGGTLTTFLNAVEERFTMAAPACFVTTYVRNFEDEECQDSEQIPPGLFARGCDMADFFIARAPRPVVILAQENDFFDLRGTRETYEEIRHVYRLLGAEENVELFVGPRGHGYYRENREAMYRFFDAHAGVEGPPDEGEVRCEEEETLRCTPRGAVLRLEGARPVFAFTRARAEELARTRKPLEESAAAETARRLLAVEADVPVPYYRILRPRWEAEKRVRNRFAVETEKGIQVIAHHVTEEARYDLPKDTRVTLYAAHLDAGEEILSGEGGKARGAETDSYVVVGMDPRGIGEVRALSCSMKDFFDYYDADYLYASAGLMLDEPYLGRKVHDIMSVAALLAARGNEVHLEGRGLGAVAGAFAALLSPAVGKVTLVNGLLSFREVAEAVLYRWPLSHMVPGILRECDLPDVYRALAAKDLVLVDPWNARMEPWSPDECRVHAADVGVSPDILRFSRGGPPRG